VIPDPNCATCKGDGFLTEGGHRNCECRGIPARDPYARPAEGWAFDALQSAIDDADKRQRDREEHARTCNERPCFRCGKHVCRECSKPFDGNGAGKCPACVRAEREAKALERVHGTVPKRFRWALTADRPTLLGRVKASAELVDRAVANPPAGNMVLLGDTAAGKTSLAVAMFDAWARQDPLQRVGGEFVEAYWLAGARARHALGQGEAKLVEDAMSATLLVLDDLGSEIDDRRNVIADVIFHRHNEDLPTWITSGFSIEQLMGRYGSQVIRRIVENAKRVELGGKR
jgi:DNA replication protein DnaC